MSYITPPVFSANGGYLSAYKLRALANNDEYFSGLADEIQMVQRLPGGGQIGNENDVCLFDGYIYLTQNTIRYGLYVNVDGIDGYVRLYFDYGGAGQRTIATYTTTGLKEDTIDAVSPTNYTKPSLYRVYVVAHYNSGITSPSGYLEYFHEVYTGALSFTSPTAFTDGVTSDYTHFDKLSDNDAYFNAITPDNFPCWQTAGTLFGDIWIGYVKHSNYRRKLYYHVKKWGGSNLYISYGGTTYVTINDAVAHEDTYTIPDATFTEGTWYQVKVWTDSGDGGGGAVYYLATGASAKSSGYNPSGQFNAGQFGWGTTANQRAAINILGTNDTDINTRLARTNYTRANHAVKKDSYSVLGGSVIANYAIRHSKPMLYYRGKGLIMGWGTGNSQGLTDYDGSHAYQTLDLASVQNLAMGQVYTITSDHDGSNCIEWACERDS